ncbi:hypothetical protein [Leifsonia sp. C5G2]|uniref:hypothetical protein n=1 Tax=Leifsonia sp. C5G2 TaxID=2735269 RepID=UPI00158583AA|nr:hypothetical protein [Leifsonia sp. C5G2]NUU07686.1 hypothetical protein [Leifsonia sp. C5G2]
MDSVRRHRGRLPHQQRQRDDRQRQHAAGDERQVRSFGVLIRVMVSLMRRLAPWQVADAKAIADPGNRLSADTAIASPALLMGGSRIPARLGRRLGSMATMLPQIFGVVIEGQGHSANSRDTEADSILVLR